MNSKLPFYDKLKGGQGVAVSDELSGEVNREIDHDEKKKMKEEDKKSKWFLPICIRAVHGIRVWISKGSNVYMYRTCGGAMHGVVWT